MRIVFLILLLIPQMLKAEYYSKEKLLQKLEAPPPEWMMRQIREDLSLFADVGISAETVEKTIRQVKRVPIAWNKASLMKVGIKDNVVSSMNNWEHHWITAIVEVLNELAKSVKLPDLEFLFCLWDFYENPSFLEMTYSPVFAIAKYKHNRYTVPIPEITHLPNRRDNEGNVLRVSAEIPWDKRIDIPFWRGATTDHPYTNEAWDYRPRARLVLFSATHPDVVNASYSHPAWIEEDMLEYFKKLNIIGDWNAVPYWLNFRYLMAVDGVSNPSAFAWELVSGSTVLKQESEYIQWFYPALEPYVHYIPFREDCSDLEEIVHWLRTHQNEAQQIAKNAFDFARNNLENEDHMLYWYLLLQEYGKLWNK